MKSFIHPRLESLFVIAEVLESAAREAARETRKRVQARKPRPRRGATLRPGMETPLWNAVVERVKPRLHRRGGRALLARELGVHRARIGEFFDRQSAMPDAERAFQLLIWLSRHADKPKTGKARG